MNRFSKILIANRGEIAVRVIQTAKAAGYRTVAVYSEADRHALHVKQADQAVCIGAAPVGESYLVIDKIIAAAQLSGADAIHPGYGFLSENTDFAAACQANDIVFIGPSSEAIELMGNKRLSKLRMIEAGVPCVPGYEGSDQSDETLIREAKAIGMPVMVKAAAGGGGRGMRLVEDEAEIANAIESARSEATNAFGSGELILEKAVIRPRHVEIQVFGDEHGNYVHLGERDCSIQRRHQKVVEESPSPAVSPEIRERMGNAAIKAASEISYQGAGTVEFLLDAENNFYFLEMNTRLQVEHPVTEEVTGTDLVAWQFLVAQGEPLPKKQDEITFDGHAIEVRLYAEDPYNDFLPQTGKVLQWKFPEMDRLRIDHCVETGQEISPFYDPMIAKVIVHGSDRETARRKLIVALEDIVLQGVPNNKDFLVDVVSHDVFAKGEATTAFIAQCFPNEELLAPVPDNKTISLAAIAFYYADGANSESTRELIGWRSTLQESVAFNLVFGDTEQPVSILPKGNEQYQISVGDSQIDLTVLASDDQQLIFDCDGLKDSASLFMEPESKLHLSYQGRSFVVEERSLAKPEPKDDAFDGLVRAPMDGRILAVNIEAGTTIEKGQVMLILEAMKMEHQIKSAVSGTVDSVNVATADQVSIRQILVNVTPDSEAEDS